MGVVTPKGVCAAVVAIGFVFIVTAIFLGLDLKPNIRGKHAYMYSWIDTHIGSVARYTYFVI